MSPRRSVKFDTSLGPHILNIGDIVEINFMRGGIKQTCKVRVIAWGSSVNVAGCIGWTNQTTPQTIGVHTQDIYSKTDVEICGDTLAFCAKGGMLTSTSE